MTSPKKNHTSFHSRNRIQSAVTVMTKQVAVENYRLLLVSESIIESTEKSIIRNKKSAQINRLIDYRLIIIIVPIHFRVSDYTSSSTSMHNASDNKLMLQYSGLGLSIAWLSGLHPNAIACPSEIRMKKRLKGENGQHGRNISTAATSDLGASIEICLITSLPWSTASMPQASLSFDSWASPCVLKALQGLLMLSLLHCQWQVDVL